MHFLGALSGEKLARHYAAADLFVFPSIADTFGLVLLEACAAGLRIAAKPVPGPSDIFADDTAKDFAALDWDLGRAVETALQLRDNSDAPRAFAHHLHGRHVHKISTLICRRRLQRRSEAWRVGASGLQIKSARRWPMQIRTKPKALQRA